MLLKMGEDGVLSKVDEDDLITVSEKELNSLLKENEKLKEQKQRICNYIQTRYNECKTPKLKEFVNPAFIVEEGSGYIGALYDLKKGLMKRGLWEITIDEHESTKINTDGWNING